jgi:hypothetical protein
LSRLNRVQVRFTALSYLTIDGTDHATHQQQSSMIRRYIRRRNRSARDRALCRIVKRAKRCLMWQ